MRAVSMVLLGLLAAACSRTPAAAPAASPSPSPAGIEAPDRVVIVLIDTLRRDRLPPYGYAKDTAPYLSRLAREGVVFENAVSTSAWTAPATASLFTGLYPFQHGVVNGLAASRRMVRAKSVMEINRVPEQAETIAELFAAAGYATFGVAQNVNLSEEMGFAQGFRRYRHQHQEKTAEFVNERALAWAERIRAEPKSYVYLHYLDPHAPYEHRAPLFDPATTGEDRERSDYDSEIHYVDRHAAAVHEALGWDDALVIVTADHGQALGEHGGQWGHSQTLYAEVTDVPLIVRFPGKRFAGLRVRDRVSHVDVVPTVRALLGLPPDPKLPGVSLLPTLAGEKLPARELYAHLVRRNDSGKVAKELFAAWGDRWKWIGGHPEGPQLYDVEADPTETRNMAKERPELVRALAASYAAFQQRGARLTTESHTVTLDAERQEQLRSLGYVN